MDFESDANDFIKNKIEEDNDINIKHSYEITSAIIDNINDEKEAIDSYSRMLEIKDLPEDIINAIEEIKSDEEEHLVILSDLLEAHLNGDEYPEPDIIYESLEESSKHKAKLLFSHPSAAKNIKTFAILTGNNPDAVRASKHDNVKFNNALKNELSYSNNVEKIILNGHYPYYKVKGKYGSVENSFIIYNIDLEEAKQLSAYCKQQSFIFGKNEGEKIIFQMWANKHKNNGIQKNYSYELVDEKDMYNRVDDAEDYYTQISRDFKINIPFEKFEPDNMVEFYNACENNPRLLENSLNRKFTGKYRYGCRTQLYKGNYLIQESLEEDPKNIEYKGYIIDNGLTYPNMVSVFVDGDDWLFNTVEEAKAEIDNFVSNEA